MNEIFTYELSDQSTLFDGSLKAEPDKHILVSNIHDFCIGKTSFINWIQFSIFLNFNNYMPYSTVTCNTVSKIAHEVNMQTFGDNKYETVFLCICTNASNAQETKWIFNTNFESFFLKSYQRLIRVLFPIVSTTTVK